MPKISLLLLLLVAGCAPKLEKPSAPPEEIQRILACGAVYERYKAVQECNGAESCVFTPQDIVQFRNDERFLNAYCL